MRLYDSAKDLADYLFAALLILVLWPVMILCATVLWLEDPTGPVLFRQDRGGRNGRIFTLMKFRTMRTETQRDGCMLSDSQRMLRCGRFMRSTSLDELPQLFNIIRGEMSFIGPRPLPTVYLPYYSGSEMHRHDVKPGITGWAQVNGRNNIDWDQKFAKDLEYVRNRSLVLDSRIIVMTLLRILRRSDIVTRGENAIMDFHEYRMKQIHMG